MDPRSFGARVASSLGVRGGSVTTLPGGTVNHVLRIRAASADLVVRIPRDVARNGDPFEVEAWAQGAARAAGLRTTRFVGRGEHDGVPWLVTAFVEGARPTAVPAIWREIGALATAVGAVDTTTAPDGLFSRFGRDLDAAWAAHLEYQLEAITERDPLIGHGAYRADRVAALRAAVDRLRLVPMRHGLVHGDLSPRNLLVGPDGTTVLDWGGASAGPTPWGDLDRINRWRLLRDPATRLTAAAWRAVLEGAGLDPAAAQPVLDDLAVVHALDVVRWALERRPARVPELVDESRRLLAALSTPAAGP